jgi:hypothetical protein
MSLRKVWPQRGVVLNGHFRFSKPIEARRVEAAAREVARKMGVPVIRSDVQRRKNGFLLRMILQQSELLIRSSHADSDIRLNITPMQADALSAIGLLAAKLRPLHLRLSVRRVRRRVG